MLAWPGSQPVSRGPTNLLHNVAMYGSSGHVEDLLSSGSIDIDACDRVGSTPLALAASRGNASVVRTLLKRGADMSIADEHGFTPLHGAAQFGHVLSTELLVRAGAYLEAQTPDGNTPLHMAAFDGHSAVIKVLLKAGAVVDSRRTDGGTPLYAAAMRGFVDALKILLLAKADPLLMLTNSSGKTFVSLDVAAQTGQLEVVYELTRQLGIEGCGGPSAGEYAFREAARTQHPDILDRLTEVGVVDSGRALIDAVELGLEETIKDLLRRQGDARRAAYVNNARNWSGRTPLFACVAVGTDKVCSPRVLRLLLDAGADTTAAMQVWTKDGRMVFNGTTLSLADLLFRPDEVVDKLTTDRQKHGRQAVHRLLLQVEAVHATSWLWPRDAHSVARVKEGARAAKKTQSPIAMAIPVLRRRAKGRMFTSATLSRYSGKP